MIKRILMLWSCTLITTSIFAQGTEEKGNAWQKVIDILTNEKLARADSNALRNEAWEALSYIEEGKTEYQKMDLLEAVPDYYSFDKKSATVKLINPENSAEYGTELSVNYRLLGSKIVLLDSNNKQRDSWTILYLDTNYMALDMGELRVFFIKTTKKN